MGNSCGLVSKSQPGGPQVRLFLAGPRPASSVVKEIQGSRWRRKSSGRISATPHARRQTAGTAGLESAVLGWVRMADRFAKRDARASPAIPCGCTRQQQLKPPGRLRLCERSFRIQSSPASRFRESLQGNGLSGDSKRVAGLVVLVTVSSRRLAS
jgi:hypothetical protein